MKSGLLIGAALMYLFDPVSGEERRRELGELIAELRGEQADSGDEEKTESGDS